MKPTQLEINHRVKMVRNDYPDDFPDDETSLGKTGSIICVEPEGRQNYNVEFEDFGSWWCTRHELRKLPSKE